MWETSQYSAVISILNPQTGATISTVPLPGTGAFAVVFDSAGHYAYVTSSGGDDGTLYKVDRASLTVVQSSAQLVGGVSALSTDDSKIFIN